MTNLHLDIPGFQAGGGPRPERVPKRKTETRPAADPSPHILAVEGDEAGLEKLASILSVAGAVAKAASAADARRLAEGGDFDLVVMETNLPDDSGLGLIRWLRNNTRALIVVHSERRAVGDRVEAYVQGADVFLPKPAPTAEVIALARSLVARSARSPIRAPEGPNWRLDPLGNLLTPSGGQVFLTIRQRLLMERLMRNRGQIVGRDELREIVGTKKTDKSGRSLDMFICRLRKTVMEQAGEEAPILVVHGKGFSFSHTRPPARLPS